MTNQIMWGSLVLGLCSITHLALLVAWILALRRPSNFFSRRSALVGLGLKIGGSFAVIVLAHTIQVWTWTVFLVALGALPDLSEAMYFSLVTYTTLGYGDVTLDQSFRIFGAMAAVTGLLNFGVSTAFLVNILGKLLSDHWK